MSLTKPFFCLVQYIRMRFNSAISLTACTAYIFLTQSIGALSIFAASLTIVTVFEVPLFWSNIVIGSCGTLYTALGGLRGVVWTDCMQLIFILLGPLAVIVKIIVNSSGAQSTIQPLEDFSIRPYIANFHIDVTHDENVWSVLIASTTAAMYRVCLDQVVVQRCMASTSLKNAQRTLIIGSFMLTAVYFVSVGMSLALVIWFRGCDPELTGSIQSYDQILPFYVKNNLVEFAGFTGLFLAAVVSASTSTISSVINSQAAVLYVDVLSQHWKIPDSRIGWVTRGLAFGIGAIMTMYSCVCGYMGSIIRVILMVSSVATGPFVGLLLLAVAFPFVHSKGAGISTLVMLILQLVLMWQSIRSEITAPRMPVTAEYCPAENTSYLLQAANDTELSLHSTPDAVASKFQLSSFWSCFFSTIGTVLLGVVVSVSTGEHRNPYADSKLVHNWFARMWRKLGIMKPTHRDEVEEEMKNQLCAEALLKTTNESPGQTVA
ncbi:sodium-coupled monocarboxylate transporter 2-like isoform X2 [Haemaphysalis longicornis]